MVRLSEVFWRERQALRLCDAFREQRARPAYRFGDCREGQQPRCLQRCRRRGC